MRYYEIDEDNLKELLKWKCVLNALTQYADINLFHEALENYLNYHHVSYDNVDDGFDKLAEQGLKKIERG